MSPRKIFALLTICVCLYLCSCQLDNSNGDQVFQTKSSKVHSAIGDILSKATASFKKKKQITKAKPGSAINENVNEKTQTQKLSPVTQQYKKRSYAEQKQKAQQMRSKK